MKNKLSQSGHILRHLMAGKTITRLEGLYVSGSMKTPERISELKEQYGLQIVGDYKGKKYMTYWIPRVYRNHARRIFKMYFSKEKI